MAKVFGGKLLGGGLVVATLLASGATGALGALPVFDQRPGLLGPSSVDRSASDDARAGAILVAGPPRWAPAHGFRRKPGNKKDGDAHYHHHHDDEVRVAVPDVGIERGFCNRELIGGILGGVAGGAIGSQVGQGDARTIATIGGTIAGVLIGGTIGRRMDEADHACVAHVVAYGPTNRAVSWSAPRGERYRVIPLAAAYKDMRGQTCRDFRTVAVVDGVERSERGTACRRANGSWQQDS